MRGKFIVIEGGDGAGKDTQIELLKKELGEEMFSFVKDPGGTDLGRSLREMILYNEATAPRTELFLLLASRTQLVAEMIEPALAAGRHVISNRFNLSTVAYQIYGRQRTHEAGLITVMSDFAFAGTRPDLVIYLDCPVEEGLRRVRQTNEVVDKFEKEKVAFHERVREGYIKHLPEYNHVIVNALDPIDVVFTNVTKAISGIV